MSRLTKDLRTPHDDTTYSDVVVNAIDREDIVLTKLKHYEDLEEELQCPLEVVFKALKEGIWFKSDDFITKNLEKDLATRPRLYYSDDFKCYRFEIGFGLHYVALKDYKKTWWLVSNKESE